MADWCRHYNGIGGTIAEQTMEQGRTCDAGIAYRDVKVEAESPGLLNRWPCFEGTTLTCPKQSFLSAAEKAERERQSRAAVVQFLADIAANVCPHCKAEITRKRQVGLCVYADPCGHRLYQGRL